MQTSLESLTSLLVLPTSLSATSSSSSPSEAAMQHQYKQKQQQQQQHSCNNNKTNNNEHQSHKRIEKRRTATKTITEQHFKTIPTTATKAVTMSTPKYASANVQQNLPTTTTLTTAEESTIRTKIAVNNALTKHWRHNDNNTNNTTINSTTTNSNKSSIDPNLQ